MGVQALNFFNNGFNASFGRSINFPVNEDIKNTLFYNSFNNNYMENHPFLNNNLPIDEQKKKEQISEQETLNKDGPPQNSNPFSNTALQYHQADYMSGWPIQQYRPVFGQLTSKQIQKQHDSTETLTMEAAAGTVSPLRRFFSFFSQVKNGDWIPALSSFGLLAFNLPEDCRDVRTAGQQLWAYVRGKKYDYKYDYKLCQHPFSFFKGTMLHKFVDPNTSKCQDFTNKLLEADNTFADTTLGKRILNFLGVERKCGTKTKIEKIGSTKTKPKYVTATIYEGSKFGKLTARAMERTTTLGLAVFGALELYKIIKSAFEGNTVADKAKNTVKQTIKSTVNIASSTAGIAYCGALGMYLLGPIGSLLGMSVGAVIGNKVSSYIQDLIG